MEHGYLGLELLRMGPGCGWTLPLISSKAGLGDFEGEPGQLEEEPPSEKKSTSRPVKKTVQGQWKRPFGRAPWEICPAISTHPYWEGDCTTTMRGQGAGAG